MASLTARARSGSAAIILTALGLAAAGTGVYGQSMPQAEFNDIKTLRCTFSISSRAVWKNEMPQPEIRKTGLLTITVTEINTASSSAVLALSSGNQEVTVQLDGRNLHLIEANRGGRVSVTTVFADYSTGTRLKAVHSRADYLPIDVGLFKSEPEIAQYYGDCEANPVIAPR